MNPESSDLFCGCQAKLLGSHSLWNLDEDREPGSFLLRLSTEAAAEWFAYSMHSWYIGWFSIPCGGALAIKDHRLRAVH